MVRVSDKNPTAGPCTQIVYTLALKYSLYRYIGPKYYYLGTWTVRGNHKQVGFGRSRCGLEASPQAFRMSQLFRMLWRLDDIRRVLNPTPNQYYKTGLQKAK